MCYFNTGKGFEIAPETNGKTLHRDFSHYRGIRSKMASRDRGAKTTSGQLGWKSAPVSHSLYRVVCVSLGDLIVST